MDDRVDTGDRADAETSGRLQLNGRLNMKVAGPAMAAGAVSLGLVLIGACGIGQDDVYVAPPPLAADLQVASTPVKQVSGTTTAQVVIPPSPTWRVAVNTPPRRTTTSAPTTMESTESVESTGSRPSDLPSRPPTTTYSTTRTTEPETPETSDRADGFTIPDTTHSDSSDTEETTTTRPYPSTESSPTTDSFFSDDGYEPYEDN
ncbi:hypothetical protein [Nocardia vermiculata]|uniref:Uncharacterized protein n=1 Tax=Nocardia vermiculata TaxID=257274 RepID=A0A846XSR2_9NOCA|nr:hypothetical protein [Nocardia vermiculata]NKY49112.1 hypothetical protein [Nocardia vermiculata]